eukprot:TRINITY_DN8805_c0_g1_i3.p1 TRINITY_DN8805_c0_g1~~TRINITY_DN8805_c0_g1_i3.p1  ORF type:complete len:106 (+),score=4.96 TRINITY_DN8805_c0_g1_i3:215-532(+)
MRNCCPSLDIMPIQLDRWLSLEPIGGPLSNFTINLTPFCNFKMEAHVVGPRTPRFLVDDSAGSMCIEHPRESNPFLAYGVFSCKFNQPTFFIGFKILHHNFVPRD